ncbi:PREDICTED: uncharacterized protein LOC105456144 [Wasmannia auropunctata]|uniref:uncharacterized protein LOC105456144 n=1 Tax=Wasmannia auropunctata TaxID=64793 RepID=UPI0005EED1B2|nr:PREDICTED: uncharacterized protein LOC105456144 [Wasmannia auropunctata]
MLNDKGFEAIGYADDLAILTRGPFLETLLELTQGALEVVEKWCRETGLSVNPKKTSLVIVTRKYKMDSVQGPVLEGVRLIPEGSVKYLGVILDKRLNWKLHLEAVCKKACTYFWMCRRTFGQTWGLQPDRVFWVYTAVLRPRLLYAAVVWWPRVQVAEARTSPERVRAFILRGALGAMRTTPVAAMGLLLGIEPFHLSIVAAAAATAYRLKCGNKWTVAVTHTRFPRELLAGAVFEMGQDRMPVRHDFSRSFRIFIPSREEWERHEVPVIRNGDVWYTDGSKTDTGAGAGIYGCRKGVREALPLGELTTVFQAEVAAIMRCAQALIAPGGKRERIRICSDSRAALGALGACIFDSRLVWECKNALDRLSINNDVALVWVPGHSGIKGNEIADELARAGSSTRMVGPEPALGVPSCVGRAEIRGWLQERHADFWKKTTKTKCQQARALLGEVPRRDLARNIRALRRREARLAVQIYTGHGFTNYHMHRLGRCDTPVCRKCGFGEETSLHVLCKCPAYAGNRRLLLGSEFLEPKQVWQLQVRDLLRFWGTTGPEPALGVPSCVGRAEIRGWLQERHADFWKETTKTKCRQARALLGEVPRRDLARNIRVLKRREARLVVQIYTGHGFTNYHMHRLGRCDTPVCRKCGRRN